MKKILLVIFSFFILCKTVNASCIVYDMDNNRVLKEINMNEKHLVASTSKIMTAIVAIENSNLDSKVIVTKDILSAVGSSIYLEIGEKISMKDLLYGMMLRSGNDAATMIAIHVSGSMEKFTEKMNEYAKKIGMNDTLFYNSHGLENKDGLGNTSTAYDMAVLTTYAMQNDKFRKIFGTKNYNCKSDRKNYSWQNKNKLLKLLNKYNRNYYIMSFNNNIIFELRKLNKKYKYGVLNYILNSKSDYDLDFICLLDGIANDYIINNFEKRGIEVIIYGTIKIKKDVKYIVDDYKL